ncbi:hypothetical protein DRW41_05180 [Neobacillus piezotolerans]|uniref:Uncharacterized protein n=1 Tax=Neobacillus piezotolerans TaxID=2259171 RepID=A0A3D8GUA8_9BACI|nr:hypothetical protein DRW41_05180 [Neobacillus piezotolerans]
MFPRNSASNSGGGIFLRKKIP